MKLSYLCIILCCGIVLAACNKTPNSTNNTPNDNGNKTSERKKFLLAGKWQEIASTATLNYKGKDTTVDLYAMDDACKKDNFITFAENGISTMNEGASICPGYDQTATCPWALLYNETELAIVDSNPDTFTFDVSATQLKLMDVKPNTSGTPVTYVSVYKNIK